MHYLPIPHVHPHALRREVKIKASMIKVVYTSVRIICLSVFASHLSPGSIKNLLQDVLHCGDKENPHCKTSKVGNP